MEFGLDTLFCEDGAYSTSTSGKRESVKFEDHCECLIWEREGAES